MILQLLSIGLVLIIVFIVLRNENRKNKRYFNEPTTFTKKERKILEKYKNEYEPIKPDSRLASIKKQKWELEDISKSATEIIYDNPIPAKDQRSAVRPGDLVKLKFRIIESRESEVERMWVRVTGKVDELFFGELDNESFASIELKAGELIWFHPNHIFEIDRAKILVKVQMNKQGFSIRKARPQEFLEVGKLMVQVYSQLEGFPKESEQPNYYRMLANVGELTNKPETELLVAVSTEDKIAGAVVYFGDMQYYGSGGTATQEKNSSGFRLLAVDPTTRGAGIGKLLTNACIQKAKESNRYQMIIHTTMAMQTAWKMYETIGFKRSVDLDFTQGELPVFGFRLILSHLKHLFKE